jgi:hypothetical protein
MRISSIGVILAATLAVAPAQAQQLDARWTPWLGCWQLSGQPVRVCVTPLADGRGVTLRTYVDDAGGEPRAEAVLEQTLVADGARHPIAEAECRGWQEADWSRTGERLFARAELTCNAGAARTVSGLSLITGDGTWIDIQGIEIAGRENIRVRRYQRAAGQVRLKPDATYAPRLGATPLTIEDVKEATGRVSPRVMEAALVETDAGFDLSSRVLRDLQRTGVAANVIDTMVALSYPRHFIVERPDSRASAAFAPVDFGGASLFGAGPYPYYGAPWDSVYWSPYFYAPFGYAYWASWGPYFPYGGYFPAAGFLSIDQADRSGDGRVIDGVGYTRIRTRDPVERGATGTSEGTSSGGSAIGGSSIPWSGGGSGVSPGGYSGGGSGGDTGRTAQPR